MKRFAITGLIACAVIAALSWAAISKRDRTPDALSPADDYSRARAPLAESNAVPATLQPDQSHADDGADDEPALHTSTGQVLASQSASGPPPTNLSDAIKTLAAPSQPIDRRIVALRILYAQRKALDNEQLLSFWQALTALAQESVANSRVASDTLWALAELGMLLRERELVSHSQIVTQCGFLVETARNAQAPGQVRRMAIAAIGDLGIVQAVPMLTELLADAKNWDSPEIGRSACISLAKLAPTTSHVQISEVLSRTTNAAVFGSAAYALGTTKSAEVIPVLVENRNRIGDNLSVDNAIASMSEQILQILEDPSHKQIVPAIHATRALWREQQRSQYVPLLLDIVEDANTATGVRQAAVNRVIEQASALPLDQEKEILRKVLPSVDGIPAFSEESQHIRRRLDARILPPASIQKRNE